MSLSLTRGAHFTALALTCLVAPAFALNAVAATPNPSEQDAIRSFGGCFEVSFDFAETIALQPNYTFHPMYNETGLEWVDVDFDQPGQINLQHILMTDDGPLKHWREEWSYESNQLFQYKGDSVWEKTALPFSDIQGRWTQRVYSVDDSPRYECAAPWIQWGSNRYWECSSWAPLPRREYTKRRDYNVLARRNRQSVQADGWLHEEDNLKLNVVGTNQTPIAKERGENHYRRVDDSKCQEAKTFWNENKTIWHSIQTAWKTIYASESRLKFTTGKPVLWQQLFDLADRAAQAKLSSSDIEREATAVIRASLIP